MRGEVLRYDDAIGEGLISGDDGQRYRFQRSDLMQLEPIFQGTRVDFQIVDGRATEIVIVHATAISKPRIAPTSTHTNEDLSLWEYFIKSFRLFASFEGRARRKEFWSFVLFYYVILIGMIGVFILITENTEIRHSRNYDSIGAAFSFIIIVFLVGTIIPHLAVTVRRLHDSGNSGWWVLISLIPYIGGIILLIMMLIPSEERVNKHGPVPKPAPNAGISTVSNKPWERK
ncbi:DUF805 domain-containing protein [Hyphobacterium sp. SN044]|uniref:DUF805 domain-containing protein n=1 Tax=Hyphobacterium sp. SN044 TaxID=2912575 RepID=UPI001F1E3ADA|nr:DUF805 domain-containing protein [Hyphobacterium sp. SN044]MCF8878942.1 DUF805 domain-containing protein [Hyphobacterium sp. SN044]